ncbi:hypothetical protein QQ045_017360 [Rhodiola kirilowii]
MTFIKEVSRSASVALAPDAPYMATGTMAGAVDLSFSSSANLELFKIDLQSDEREMPVVGACQSSERFNRLSWGKNGSGSEEFSLGLVAGGLVDGNIDLWNPHTLINSDASESALVGHLSRHKSPVRGLEFNVSAPNLLASGADEGEICIWDLTKPTEPSHFPPLKGSGSATQGEISFLSWNSKVQHILASTSYDGTTVVWDLKKQKPVISFPDPNRRKCSVLQWNPDVATQLVVASDDDASPSLRLWDMRNIMSPVKEFVGHTKGVIAMSWCPVDSSYLLTCAKDNRTICWDTTSAEIVCELPSGTNWNFDVHWYTKVPGVISASSFDGKIGLYNIEGCSRYGVGDSEFLSAPIRAPKWYKRPAGVSFGFGGKLVSFHPEVVASCSSEIHVYSIVIEDSLIDRTSEFEAAIHDGDRTSLRTLCEKKYQESPSEDDRETWGFLKIMFEDDGTARTKLLTHLGFSLPAEEKSGEQDILSEEVAAVSPDETAEVKEGYEADKGASFLALDNNEEFFNNLSSPAVDTPVSTSENGHTFVAEGVDNGIDDKKEELDAYEESDDPSFDDAIQRALVVGDYKAAVAQCISANKMANALVIAHLGGPSLWESTRDQYLKTSRSPYLKVVGAMVNSDLMKLVNTRPLKFWKETLALLCSFAQREEWTLLCDTLASKLIAVGETLAATLCYICAGNIDKTVEIWSRTLVSDHEGKSYVDLLQDLMEKTIVLALATGQKKFSAFLCKLVEKYVEILASQGLTKTAMECLKLLGSDELSPELLVLRDRIAQSEEAEKEVPQNTGYESSQIQGGPAYESDRSNYGVEKSQNYYQETAPSHGNGMAGGASGVYQQPYPSTYGDGYGIPAPYQPPPPPNMFIPSQTVQNYEPSFASSPVVNQPPARPFIPSHPPALVNAEKYQQSMPTPTLGSQLYSGNVPYQAGVGVPVGGSLPSQVGMIPGPRPHQVMAPTPQPLGFMPVNNSEFQRPGGASTQPSSPTMSTPVQQVAAPPPTVQTADTSSIPAHQKTVIATTLTRLFNETSEALGGSRANPAKRREIEDNSKKIGALFAKLNSGDISQNAALKLVELCQSLDNGDFIKALQIQVQLTTSEWDECNFWLAALKRMIKTRQSVRIR